MNLQNVFDLYWFSLSGSLVILATVFVQSLVASIAHRKQKEYVPGVVDEDLGHESFVFRSHRTFMNSIENVQFMIMAVFLSIFCGVQSFWLGVLVWVYAVARIIHMILYYKIATEKNPSPRSYFFMIAIVAQLSLLIMIGVRLFAEL
jgi:glutathione S-transferase